MKQKKQQPKQQNDHTANTGYVKGIKFIAVHIMKIDSELICKATTDDGVTENYIWSRKGNRNIVHSNADTNIKITVDSNVPAKYGWNWDYKY